MEILCKKSGGPLRDRRERDVTIGIDAPLKGGQQPVISSPMETPGESRFCERIVRFFTREFSQPMKQGMNNDDIGIQAVDSGRQDQIERGIAEKSVVPAQKPIRGEPTQELQEMWATYRGHLVPPDGACFPSSRNIRMIHRNIFNALGK